MYLYHFDTLDEWEKTVDKSHIANLLVGEISHTYSLYPTEAIYQRTKHAV